MRLLLGRKLLKTSSVSRFHVHGRAGAVSYLWSRVRQGLVEFQVLEGGTNFLSEELSSASGLGSEILGTFILVYLVYSAIDAKRKARDSHVPVRAPLPIGFAVFVVHLVTIPITGCGINPARSLGAAVVWNHEKAWDDQWIFWVGSFIGATLAAAYHQFVIRLLPLGEHFLFPSFPMGASSGKRP